MVTALVDKLVAPKIENCSDWCEDKNKEYSKADYFQKYLERSYAKYSIVNTLVFHNSQRLLKSIYITPSLIKDTPFKDEKETIKIDHFPRGLVKKYKKILIVDTAGMGKSTILKRMFIDLIESGKESKGVPIYIELNRLNKNHTILQVIQEDLSSSSEQFDKDSLLRFIQTGGFVFFMDGYDEISIADRYEVTKDIQNFISITGMDNCYFLTSRPDDRLMSFEDFQLFCIHPLKKEGAYELLRKFDLSTKKELSGNLIELLKSRQNRSLDEFLKNPLLVSLLFSAYDYNRSIPFEKHRFYGVVFEAYFEKHDNSKSIKKREKYSGLNYEAFDRVLRYVGYDCLIRTGVTFDMDTILNTIRRAKDYCGISGFSEYDFFQDLVSTVPLFYKDGIGYKWAHKSLMEYFAARFIYCDAKQNRDAILTAMYNSEKPEKYYDILDLYYDIDPKGFDKNITLPFCERFIQFYDDNIFITSIKNDIIEQRISHMFWGKSAFFVSPQKISLKEVRNSFSQADFGFDRIMRFDTITDGFVYFACDFSKNIAVILELFREKSILQNRKIFSHEAYEQIKENGIQIISGFEPDKVIIIDLRTGDQNQKMYYAINFFISAMTNYEGFDYMACRKESERIRKEISLCNDPSDLLAGI